MEDRMELTASSPHSARIELDTIQARRIEAQELAEHIGEVADYAREVAAKGSWSEEGTISIPNGRGGSNSRRHRFSGTQFIPLKGGASVAVREIRPNQGTDTRHSLMMRNEESEPEEVAIIDGTWIEIVGVGEPQFYEVTCIRGLLDYIDAHDTK